MVASFEVMLYVQFHSRPLQLSMLAIWDKEAQFLAQSMRLNSKTKLSLKHWISHLMLKLGKAFPYQSWEVLTANASLSSYGAALLMQETWLSEA